MFILGHGSIWLVKILGCVSLSVYTVSLETADFSVPEWTVCICETLRKLDGSKSFKCSCVNSTWRSNEKCFKVGRVRMAEYFLISSFSVWGVRCMILSFWSGRAPPVILELSFITLCAFGTHCLPSTKEEVQNLSRCIPVHLLLI